MQELIENKSFSKIEYVSPENIKDILYFQNDKYIEIFRSFLKINDKGYYAYLNDNCIHRSWVKSNEQIIYHHWTIPYKLKRNEAFIHYCETAPEARGRSIYPHILTKISQDFKGKKIIISVNKNNIASLRGVEKVGFVPIQTIQTILLFGFRYKKVLINDK